MLTLSALLAVGLDRVRITAWPVLLASNPYTVAVGLFSLQEGTGMTQLVS